jgi:hypothetical protein
MKYQKSFIAMVTVGASLLSLPSGAGDLERLPVTQAGFERKIAAFIKTGNPLKDAISLLEQYEFDCTEDGVITSCERSDGTPAEPPVRLYQVIMESVDGTIESVGTFTATAD